MYIQLAIVSVTILVAVPVCVHAAFVEYRHVQDNLRRWR